MTALDWTAIEDESTGLPSLLSTLMGVPVEWRNQPRKMQRGAHATLDVLAPTSIGVDQSSWQDVGDPATAVEETIRGDRELTLQVSVWSPSQSLAESARKYLGDLRTRLRWESSLSSLRALGVALVRIEDVADADVEQDGRIRSAATMDVRLAYIDVETDAEIPYIETAEATGEVENAEGVVSLQTTIEHP